MREHKSDFTDYLLFYLLSNLSTTKYDYFYMFWNAYIKITTENIFFTHFKFASKINFPENKEKENTYMEEKKTCAKINDEK